MMEPFNVYSRKVTTIVALIALIVTSLGVSYASQDYEQQRNGLTGLSASYGGELILNFEEVADWASGDGPVRKEISVINTGREADGDGDIYARIQLKEYMGIETLLYVNTAVRYMVGADGEFIIYNTESAAQAAVAANGPYPAHSYAFLTDAVTNKTGWFIQTRDKGPNGQMGKYVVTNVTAGAVRNVIGGLTGPNKAQNTDPNVHPNDECAYAVHTWDGNELESREYIDWILNDDDIVLLSAWDGQPTDKWIIDDDSGQFADEGWVYWGQALPPGESTALFMEAVDLIKQPEGSFYYVVHADLQLVSPDEIIDGNVDWGGVGNYIRQSAPSIAPTGINILEETCGLYIGDTYEPFVVLSPLNTTFSPSWISSNPSVASIDPKTGLITGVSEGFATITASIGTGPVYTDSAEVKVIVAPEYALTNVVIHPPGYSNERLLVDAGSTLQFTAVAEGKGAVPQGVLWQVSGDSSGTSIDSDGLLTVAADESAEYLTVWAHSAVNASYFNNAYVDILYPMASVEVEPSGQIEVLSGGTRQFNATLQATGAKAPVTWRVLGNRSTGTKVSGDGLFQAAVDEPEGTLTVRAYVQTTEYIDTAVRIVRPAYRGETRIPYEYEYVGTSETYGLYEGALPCVGSPRVVVFAIDFPGDYPGTYYSIADIEKSFFDNSHVGLPYEQQHWEFENEHYSLRDFYYRASYGKLDITGDVVPYSAQKPWAEYSGLRELIQETMAAAGSEDALDWSQYDVNEDGFVDGVYYVFLDQVFVDFRYHKGNEPFTRAGKQLSNYVFTSPNAGLIAHETGHLFGHRDIYLGADLNPGGTGANTVMDGNYGDLPGIMKCLNDWMEPQYIDTAGQTQVTLSSFSDQPDCAIIYPKGDKYNLNWFLVEYITATNNNFYHNAGADGGLRIWRVTMAPGFFHGDKVDEYAPFEYLEAVHPTGFRDYFFFPGDSFTPNSRLNSNYPGSFKSAIGPSGVIKTMQDLTDSGVYLENIRIVNGEAKFTVTIK